MTDINERETIEYFNNGLRKAHSAAKELAMLHRKAGWDKIAIMVGNLLQMGAKLNNAKSQSRLQILSTANMIEAETAKPAETVH